MPDPHRRPQRIVDSIKTEKMIPVLIGNNYEHIMGKASIEQFPASKTPEGSYIPPKVEINIVAEGDEAKILGDFVASIEEIVALSFGGVPVRPITKKESK